MSFHPKPPTISLPPTHVGGDTWLVHHVQEALGAPLRVLINSMVIRGTEPVIVDTGTIANRHRWLEDTFGLVEPDDVRWVFISHDDVDHTGNLVQVMEACPNATLLASWALVERFSNAFEFPLERCRWVNDGDHLDLEDRRLSFVRPPVWDSPSTRGLFDHSTGVYWAVDAFAAPCSPEIEPTVDDLDPSFWAEGMAMFAHNALSPWLSLVDPHRFDALVQRVRSLGMNTIASGHSPLIAGAAVDRAFELLSDLPFIAAPPVPGHDVLEAALAAATVGAS
jgi:flavorubredoxin